MAGYYDIARNFTCMNALYSNFSWLISSTKDVIEKYTIPLSVLNCSLKAACNQWLRQFFPSSWRNPARYYGRSLQRLKYAVIPREWLLCRWCRRTVERRGRDCTVGKSIPHAYDMRSEVPRGQKCLFQIVVVPRFFFHQRVPHFLHKSNVKWKKEHLRVS